METSANKPDPEDHLDAAIAATADAIYRMVIEISWEFDDLSNRRFTLWTRVISRAARAACTLARACSLLAEARVKPSEQHKKQAKEQLKNALKTLKERQAKVRSRPNQN
jgi:hypothetical protein